MRRLAVGVVALVLTGASAGGIAHAQQGEFPATDPNITSGKAQQQLDAARARWKTAGVKTYSFRVALGCFCPPEVRAPHVITVRRGAPVRPPDVLKNVATVPRLFRTIQGAIDGKVAPIQVTYGARGVPSAIGIDRSREIADEEQYYAIDRFKKLKR